MGHRETDMIWYWYRLVQWFRDWTPPSRTRALRSEYATARYALAGFEAGLRTDREWMDHWILGVCFRNITAPKEFTERMKAKYTVRLDPATNEYKLTRRRGSA